MSCAAAGRRREPLLGSVEDAHLLRQWSGDVSLLTHTAALVDDDVATAAGQPAAA
jgi:hypothetical protein